MMDDGAKPIIVKRIKKYAAGHHGGAWKIAYADFVTAMMAFFLLMWLLGSTSKGDLNGISEFFKTPLKVAMQGGSGSGDSSSIIKGGGKDLSRQDGQVNAGGVDTAKKSFNLSAAKAALEKEETQRLQTLKERIQSKIENSAALQKFKDQLLLDFTSEGLRIQIVDEQNRPMFPAGKADLQQYTREILEEIAPVLNDVPNRIGLTGHTDSTPYFSETGYSNWELSADRANASRRALVQGGMQDNKIIRVVGLASAAHLDRKDPFNPINRRISIIVMNKKTEENLMRDAGRIEVGTDTEATRDAAARGAQATGAPATK
ncbi:flagellar motor protein MotB [Pseudoduganella chitinolytica]|uniref:Flagellar motor protein MotB n=1 Tax=Pseudoduganella chitinolytica TaxID=34070 RepID=A0ABY8BKC1_9BURK|nr:flagellar motor protein MotB [Pseudoduganella chitinolytica]WEF35853.1 flagellar motor protein MotB [Pseudoduganella chitinolytica]